MEFYFYEYDVWNGKFAKRIVSSFIFTIFSADGDGAREKRESPRVPNGDNEREKRENKKGKKNKREKKKRRKSKKKKRKTEKRKKEENKF